VGRNSACVVRLEKKTGPEYWNKIQLAATLLLYDGGVLGCEGVVTRAVRPIWHLPLARVNGAAECSLNALNAFPARSNGCVTCI
jgi:hypothetical protein